LTMNQYVDFLPGGDAYRGIRALTSFYAGAEYDMELQLILKRAEVPRCELTTGEGPRLGWTSWMKNAAFVRDPDETILEL
jgi:type VI secretion system protein ImpH